MIYIDTYNPHRKLTVAFYDEWDIDPTKVVSWNKVNAGDVGKYVKFDDGSNLYAKIFHATPKIVVTSAGQFRKADLVHCAVPKDPTTTCYGCDLREVHPLIRPYTQSEKKYGLMHIANPHDKSIHLTKRIKMFTVEELQKEAQKDTSYNASDFYRAIKATASVSNMDGRNFWKALKVMGQIHGKLDIDKVDEQMWGKLLTPGHQTRQLNGSVTPVREMPNQRLVAEANIED